MQVRDARDLSAGVADDALVDAGVGRPHVEHHQRIVAVGRIVGDAVLVRRADRPVVVVPVARGRRRRVDLAPEVRHRAVVEVLVAHRFDEPRRRHRRRLDVMHAAAAAACRRARSSTLKTIE